MDIRWDNESDWAIAGGRRGVRRGVAVPQPRAAVGPQLGRELERLGIEIAIQQTVVPKARRGTEPPALDFTVDCAPDERAVTILRHPSRASTFHGPQAMATTPRRGRSPAVTSLHFHIELAEQSPQRRGLISAGIELIVAKVKEKLIDAAVSAGLHAAALGAETLWWRQRKLTEGWHAIASGPGGIRLTGVQPGDITGARSLLFLHGTFSDTVGSFGSTLQPQILQPLLDRYEGRVFGFEHFSVSRTPEENARMLLEFLPDREQVFDVVSYSRGGLVLRTLAEQAASLGPLGHRFRLDRGVLVAVPNGGTPLATGRRWEETFGLLATLLNLVPDNPLTPITTAAAFIADGLVWVAGHLTGDLPGLEAMDADGASVAALQERASPSSTLPNYSAIGANYHPAQNVWQKLLDGGIDGFFAGANDLVVPSDGALAVDPGAPRIIPADRVACFGQDGNVRATAGDVHHLNILAQEETAAFILRALRGEKQNLPVIDLGRPLSSRKPWRGGAPGLARPVSPRRVSPSPVASPELPPATAQPAVYTLAPNPNDLEGDCTLHLMIIDDPTAASAAAGKVRSPAQIIAIYGSARVVEPFGTRDAFGEKGAGTRFHQIIELDRKIQMNLEGIASKKTLSVPELPDDDSLREFGSLLFEALFTPRVRRLYDLARAEQRGRALNVVFTCTIPWVASKPWEFCFDPYRRKFLATEEIHFVRNVLTAVPAQRLVEVRDKLRLLVVEAQPAGTAELALEEEERQIRFRFQPLIDAGLVEVDVLAQATPARLHEMIVSRNLEQRSGERRPYDVVHFIGHGEFDREASQGRLLFYDQPVETQTLRELLCTRGLQLVFLNACDTARDAGQKLNRGVASALVEGGVPAVVANQYKVLDPSAVAFANQFYWALANGATLGEAAREARIAVNYSMEGEIIDWAVPVLYARDPDRRFCVRRPVTVPLKRTISRPPAAAKGATLPAKGGTPPPLLVGIADLARYFTGLEDIISRLNSVQQRFVFRLVEINTPMGVWEHDPADGVTRLSAERFAAKLKDKPRALGLDLLACVTNWWMRDTETKNLYGWWSADAAVPVLIFSTAGLALPTHGPAAGRVVANELVCGIACQLAEAATGKNPMHPGPPKDCPLYHNTEREVASVAGPLRLSKASRTQLLKMLPEDIHPAPTVAAFEAMLTAFDGDLTSQEDAQTASPPLKTKRRVAGRKRQSSKRKGGV